MQGISEIIDAIKKLEGLTKDKEVASLLEMTSAALSNHKMNGTIPYQNVMLFCHTNRISYDFILAGTPARRREEEIATLREINGLQKKLMEKTEEVEKLKMLQQDATSAREGFRKT